MPASGEIRVLDLLPGKSGPIECELIHVSLDNSGQYETLSYVWGNQNHNKVVIVDGVESKVTPNLEKALQRLRHPAQKRRLWVDQLCISQWDKSEKTRQVDLMRDIYKSCTRCLIWFGEIDEKAEGLTVNDTQAALDLLDWVAAAGIVQDIDTPSTLSSNSTFKGGLRAFRALVLNSWWSRIWTVQEVVLPPRSTVMWGPLSVPFEVLELAALNVCNGCFPSELRSSSHYEQFCDILEGFTDLVRGLDIAKSGERALDVLQRWRYRDSSEPLDKVYALIGLFPSLPFPSIHSCNYELSANTVYTRVTLDMIRQESGLRPLIGRRGEPQVTSGLRTWVLDLTRYPDSARRCWKWRNHSHRYSQFKADSGRRLTLESLENDTILSLVGVHVDEIAKVGSVVTEVERGDLSDDQLNGIISEWEEMLNRHISEGATSPYPERATWTEAFWRALLGDMIMEEFPVRRATEADRKKYNAFRQTESQNDIYLSLRDMVVNQSFFITSNGYLGLGPPTIQEGDEVWVLFGGQVPFILRPKTVEGVSSGNVRDIEHEFVGDAYVHGIMNGEVETLFGDTHETVFLV
jgi:hypothetical protein